MSDRLPTELLAAIFLLGLSDDPPLRGFQPFPLLITQICRRWREVAIGTKRLWCHVLFRERDPDSSWSRLCLDRSGNTPVSIDVTLTREWGWSEKDCAAITKIMNIIMQHTHHWGTLRVSADVYMRLQKIVDLFFAVPDRAAPLLRKLALVYPPSIQRPLRVFETVLSTTTVKSATLTQVQTPQLRHLELVSISLAWNPTPLSELTYIQLSHQQPGAQPTIDEFIALLRASPKLTTLKVNGGPAGPFREDLDAVIAHRDAPDSDRNSAVILKSLRTLEMTLFQDEPVVLLLMDIIRAPQLESLHLKDWIGDNFDRAVRRVGDPVSGYPSTAFLDMRALEGTGSVPFHALLSGMVNVKRLELSCTDKPRNHAVSCLVPPKCDENGVERTPVVMPELLEFKFTGIPPDEVETMLRTRADAGKPLTKLVINEWDNVSACPFVFRD